MSSMYGKLTSCDVCGATVFSRATGEGETDGGYTRWTKFEPMPAGWEHVYTLGTLCPKCAERYERKMKQLVREMEEEAKQ